MSNLFRSLISGIFLFAAIGQAAAQSWPARWNLSGSNPDAGNKCLVDNRGNVIVCGTTTNTTNGSVNWEILKHSVAMNRKAKS